MLVVVTWMNFVKSFSRNANMIVFGKPPLNWKKRYLSTTVKEGWIYVLVTKVRNRPQRSPPHYIYIPFSNENPPRDFQVSMPSVSLPQRGEVRSARPAVIFEATNLQVTATGTID